MAESTGGISRTATNRMRSSILRPDGSVHTLALPLGGPEDQKPPHRLAIPFCPERLRELARFHAMLPHSCATAKQQPAILRDSPVYSPQRSTSSATVHALCSTPAMCLDEIIVSEIERNRSLKVFKLFAECVREPGKTAKTEAKVMNGISN